MLVRLLLTASLCAVLAAGYVPVNANMRSFSYAIKDGSLKANVEKTLYARSTGEPGVITEQWFTGECRAAHPSFLTGWCACASSSEVEGRGCILFQQSLNFAPASAFLSLLYCPFRQRCDGREHKDSYLH